MAYQGYTLIRVRREMLLEKYHSKHNAKKWKRVLDLSSDAVVICGAHSILYSNPALRALLATANISTAELVDGFNVLFSTLQLHGPDQHLLWRGIDPLIIELGLCVTAEQMTEAQYLAYDNNQNLRYNIEKRTVSFKGVEASLLFIREATRLEQAHTKATEEKYKHQVLRTITHDLKTPLTIIKGQLSVLPTYVSEEGQKYLTAAQISTASFEYYIYDLIVRNYVKKW